MSTDPTTPSLDARLTELVQHGVREALLRMPEELADQLVNRPLVLTKREAANLLHCSVSQVEKWLAAGMLDRMPHTAKVLIPRKSLEDFVTATSR